MIEIITNKMDVGHLKDFLTEFFPSMIKYVVDIEREILAIGGELHADAEMLLLEDGSKQENLWGANIYPYKTGDSRIEYTSFINIRPLQNNDSMEIADPKIREKVKSITEKLNMAADERLA